MDKLGFAAPLFLVALAALPLLWWLIRKFPPRPSLVRFPPFQILARLQSPNDTSQTPPLWLLILRMLVAAAIALLFAGPYLKPEPQAHTAVLQAHRYAIMLLDNGFGAAQHWQEMLQQAESHLKTLEASGIPVALVATVTTDAAEPVFESAEAARSRLNQLAPQPQAALRASFSATINTLLAKQPDSALIWLSDGVDYGDADTFLKSLPANLPRLFYAPPPDGLPLLLRRATIHQDGLTLRVTRIGTAQPFVPVTALNTQGVGVFTHQLNLDNRDGHEELHLPLPVNVLNQARTIRLGGQQHSGGLWLLDGRSQIQTAGIIRTQGGSQPLLQETFYLEKALQGVAKTSQDTVAELIDEGAGLIVLPDAADLSQDEQKRLSQWVEAGGVLVRFAGPRLGKDDTGEHPLLPVPLKGTRSYSALMLGNAEQPLFRQAEPGTPLEGLSATPPLSIRVLVMADPLRTPNDRIWARTSDQSPLITARPAGKGYVVLCHTAALPAWSELPISGTLVTLFDRLLQLTRAEGAASASGPLYPQSLLDGFGNLQKPATEAMPITGSMLSEASAKAPVAPGYYGNAGGMIAVNQAQSTGTFQKLRLPAAQLYGQESQPVSLLPWIGAVLALLWIADMLVPLRDWLHQRRRALSASVVVAVCVLLSSHPAGANPSRPYFTPMLAYVKTGDAETDRRSQLGLSALTEELARRTSFDGGAPAGVDLNTDDLTAYPVLYWPLSQQNNQNLRREGGAKLRQFMRTGGLLIIDLIDGNPRRIGEEAPVLANLLNLSAIAPAGKDHVLTRTFYLLHQFPGRWGGGEIWVESPDETVNDGVSPVIIGAADWAGAWARDASGKPLLPVVPGGEQQRDYAYRSGINFVLYAMTGNYKADQIHLPTLLERMGK